jgi:hypothetical protein
LAILHVTQLALTSKPEGFDGDECAAALAIVYEIIDDVAAAWSAHRRRDPTAGDEAEPRCP